MAIGAARIMGFKLMTNFNAPYQSKSVSEFWKRWHISLSTWFKDYLYISLGGNQVTIPRWYLNLFIVFLVSGVWHGAKWTFVIWGALHGFYLVFGLITRKFRERESKRLHLNRIPMLASLLTFMLVAFAWIFFRAKDVNTAIYICTHLFTGIPALVQKLRMHQSVFEYMGLVANDLVLSVLLIVFLEVVHFLKLKRNLIPAIASKPVYVRWAIYYLLVFSIIYLGVTESRQFIYFQF